MALTPAQHDALTTALSNARNDVRARVVRFAETMWADLGDWRDDDVARFIAAVAPRVAAGKLQVARLTDAYMAILLDVDPAGVTDLSQIRGGVAPGQVYARPAASMRTALAEGAPFAEALQRGAVRLRSLVETDLQLAHTHQARASMSGRAKAFRRVPTGRESCALCLIASTQRYWVEELLPIHPGCDCAVEPLGAGASLDQVIDPGLLEAVHAQVESLVGYADRGGRDVDYRHLVATRQHGEYGPTIAWRDHHFTDADAAKRGQSSESDG